MPAVSLSTTEILAVPAIARAVVVVVSWQKRASPSSAMASSIGVTLTVVVEEPAGMVTTVGRVTISASTPVVVTVEAPEIDSPMSTAPEVEPDRVKV